MPYVSKTWQNISSSPALKSMYSSKPAKEAQNLDKERKPQIVGSYLLDNELVHSNSGKGLRHVTCQATNSAQIPVIQKSRNTESVTILLKKYYLPITCTFSSGFCTSRNLVLSTVYKDKFQNFYTWWND